MRSSAPARPGRTDEARPGRPRCRCAPAGSIVARARHTTSSPSSATPSALTSLGCTRERCRRQRGERPAGSRPRCVRRRRACGRPRGGDCARRAGGALRHSRSHTVSGGAAWRAARRRSATASGRRRSASPRRPGLSSSSASDSTSPVPTCEVCLLGRDRPGRIGSHARRMVTPIDATNTISSRCSASGRTAVARAEQDGVDAGVGGAARAISSCTSSTVSRSKSSTEAGELGGDAPVVHRRALRVTTCCVTRCTRPSRLVIVPVFSPHTVTGRNTSARRASDEGVDGDHEVDRWRAPGGARSRSGKSAWDRRRAARAPSIRRGRCEDAGGVESGGVGHPPPVVSVAARLEVDPPGQEPGREAQVERAVHVAATQCRQERRVAAPASAAPPSDHRAPPTSQRRPAEHDHDGRASGRSSDVTADRSAVARRGAVARERAGRPRGHGRLAGA